MPEMLQELKELARLSKAVGGRVDYTQGGGGNTSVKLPNGLMAIKASGFRLSDMTECSGFAVVETQTLRDVTQEQGYQPLRPSVEVSFHALLKKYVLHTHPVYANLALCSRGGEQVAGQALSGKCCHLFLPYINPGAELADAMRDQLTPQTNVILMQNHGLVVTADDADECLELHRLVNERIAEAYHTDKAQFDRIYENFSKVLYPDQQVYLELTGAQQEILTAVAFIQFVLMQNGVEIQSMDESAQAFIASWESEAYRKTILK